MVGEDGERALDELVVVEIVVALRIDGELADEQALVEVDPVAARVPGTGTGAVQANRESRLRDAVCARRAAGAGSRRGCRVPPVTGMASAGGETFYLAPDDVRGRTRCATSASRAAPR